MKKQPTLHDVAHLAHVSHQTVSRVINNSPYVAPATRKRVVEAIQQLAYRPNRAARSLITGRSQMLQIITFNLYFFVPLMYIIAEAKSLGYHVGVSALNDPNSMDELGILFDDLTSLVDGFLLFGPEIQLNANELNKLCRGIPFVQLGADPAPMIPAVIFDQSFGVRQIMDHLYGLGHRKIAEIPGFLTNHDGRVRHETYLAYLEEKELAPKLFIESDFSIQGGYQAAGQLLDKNEPFTALICGNDQIAFGALHLLHERGYAIPKDVSIVGFDDDPPVGYIDPPLTTVRQDYTTQGRQGIQYLVSLIENPGAPRYQQVIYPQLIIRKSTSFPRDS